jgi:hypothetical protein
MSVDTIFDWCVVLLKFAANMTGTTYKEINVIIFCVIWPLATIALIAAVIIQNQQIKTYRELLDERLDDELLRQACSFIPKDKTTEEG